MFAREINKTDGKKDSDFSFNVFELDAASNNGVEDIRSLIDQVRIPPQVGQFKVYIIDEVHMLSSAAFNAFLKTLEEPPAHAIFILATTEKHKILPTILSRCQIYDFHRIGIKDMVAQLEHVATKENVTLDPDAAHLIAEKADGGMRDALSIFDQIVAFSGNEVHYKDVIQNLNILDYDYYFQLADALKSHDIPASLLKFDEILRNGFDGHLFINGLAAHFRNLMVCIDETTKELLEVAEGLKSRYIEQASGLSQELLIDAISLCTECDYKYVNSKNQRLLVELTLMQIASLFSGGKKKI